MQRHTKNRIAYGILVLGLLALGLMLGSIASAWSNGWMIQP